MNGKMLHPISFEFLIELPFDLYECNVFFLIFDSNYFKELSNEIVVKIISILNEYEIADGVDFVLVLEFLILLVDVCEWLTQFNKFLQIFLIQILKF